MSSDAVSLSDVSSLRREIEREFPAFQIVRKEDSSLMRTINVCLLVLSFGRTRRFMHDFVTTIGEVVYVPSSWVIWSNASVRSVLRHERVHMRQKRRYGFLLFAFLYLFFPLPVLFARYRVAFEKEAYEETIRSDHACGKNVRDPLYRYRMVQHFVSEEYLWMTWDRRAIEMWFDSFVRNLTADA